MTASSPPDLAGNQTGTTLVEVMVSSIILAMTILAVVTMIRKARDIDFESDIQLQAKRLAHAALEENDFHPSQYTALAEETRDYADLEIYPAVNSTRPIVVEKRVVIGPEVLDETGWVNRSIPYRKITATITWDEGTQSVSATKRIARTYR